MDPLRNYYRALGKFINEFAKTEDFLFVVLARMAGLSHREAAALFSGMRVRAGIDSIKRLHEAKDARVPRALTEAFEQLVSINTFRDRLVHWGIERDGDQFVASNVVRSHAERTQRNVQVSSGTVLGATRDLLDIQKTLILYLLNTDGSADPISDVNNGRKHQADLRARAWRFSPNP